MELRFLFSAHGLMVVYICIKFQENMWVLSCNMDMIFILIISKGHNSTKNVGGVMFLFVCTSSDDDLDLHHIS